MSEMMECMKDIAEARKSNRSKVAERNVTELKRLSIPAVEQSKNVWRIDGPLGAVMYYPTSNKWQHHSRTKAGSVADLRSWLQKNGYL